MDEDRPEQLAGVGELGPRDQRGEPARPDPGRGRRPGRAAGWPRRRGS